MGRGHDLQRLSRTVVSSAAAVAAAWGCVDPSGPNRGLHQRWHAEHVGLSLARPAVAGDLVYFGTGDGQVLARERSNGRQRWAARVSQTAAVEGSNLLVRSGVVVAPVAVRTFGLDAETGREIWRYEAPRDVAASPVSPPPGQVVRTHIDADDEAAYIGAWGASISAVELRTGVVRWVWRTPDADSVRAGSMGVRVRGDTVYATVWHYTPGVADRCEPWVLALDRRTGRELWRVLLPQEGGGACMWSTPAIYRDLVLVSTLGGVLYAIDMDTRSMRWEQRTEARHIQPTQPEVFRDQVYVDGGDGSFSALRAADGAVVWRAEHGRQATKDALITERRAYVTTGPELHVFDRQTGRRVAKLDPPRGNYPTFTSAPAAVDGQVFVTVSEGAWSFDEP